MFSKVILPQPFFPPQKAYYVKNIMFREMHDGIHLHSSLNHMLNKSAGKHKCFVTLIKGEAGGRVPFITTPEMSSLNLCLITSCNKELTTLQNNPAHHWTTPILRNISLSPNPPFPHILVNSCLKSIFPTNVHRAFITVSVTLHSQL